MKGIVITTSQYTREFLLDCLNSLKDCKYPVLIVSNGGYNPSSVIGDFPCKLIINDWNGWELGGIERGKETFEEFVHLMDTTLVKDQSFFDKVFAVEGNVVFTKGNFHYMGKFVSNKLPNTPRIHTKDMGIFMETTWLPEYTEFTPDLPVHTDNFVTRYGQKRMRLENEYLIKDKGTFFRSAAHP